MERLRATTLAVVLASAAAFAPHPHNAYSCSSAYCAGCAFWPCDPCTFNTSFAFDPQSIPNDEYNLLAHNEYYIGTLRPNACNVCPTAGREPIWAAPGDVCTLIQAGAAAPECSVTLPGRGTLGTDYKPSNHVKACVTAMQRNDLWKKGACHDTNTTLPYVAKDGLLFCTTEQRVAHYYSWATLKAAENLEGTHPIRLDLALNLKLALEYSIFLNEVIHKHDEAITLAQQALDDAIARLPHLSSDVYRDAMIIMQLLRDNLTLWTTNKDEA